METGLPKQRINGLIRKYKYPIAILLVGLVLMLLPESNTEETPAQNEPAIVDDLESRLEAILSKIDGAGEVSVLLTEDRGRELLYQTDTQSDDSGANRTEDTVLVDGDGSESGLIRQTLEPEYRGAVILCQGADDPGVRLAIVEAVRCVTGLGADEISVLKMK